MHNKQPQKCRQQVTIIQVSVDNNEVTLTLWRRIKVVFNTEGSQNLLSRLSEAIA
jgi:hypothetical protein